MRAAAGVALPAGDLGGLVVLEGGDGGAEPDGERQLRLSALRHGAAGAGDLARDATRLDADPRLGLLHKSPPVSMSVHDGGGS